jgi:hypothetical protein
MSYELGCGSGSGSGVTLNPLKGTLNADKR